jgi:hypothetical protein
VANTLAYYDTATITAVKSFIVQAQGVEFLLYRNFKKPFFCSNFLVKFFMPLVTQCHKSQAYKAASVIDKKENIFIYTNCLSFWT